MSLANKIHPVEIKLNNRRMSEIISEEITGWIMDGTLDAGQRIREDELAEVFGVSRIPVREALRALSNRGLVEIEPYVGTTVSKLTQKDIQEIYYLRSVLEPIACKQAAMKISDEEIEALREVQNVLEDVCIQKGDHLVNSKTVYHYNREFHMGIYRISEMDILLNIIDNLWDRIAFLRIRTAYSDTYPEQMRNEHQMYLKLLSERDGETLANALRMNLEHHLMDIINANLAHSEGEG